MPWKAEPVGKLFGSELSAIVPAWGETTEVMLSDQAQVPYPVLVPDVTSSAKRSTLYSALFGAGGGDGGMVKCGSSGDNEWRETYCHAKYEVELQRCDNFAYVMGGERGKALCKQNAWNDYQECRGY